MVYLGSMTNFDGTYSWIQDKCVPLVREITFENGEVWAFSCVLLFLIHISAKASFLYSSYYCTTDLAVVKVIQWTDYIIAISIIEASGSPPLLSPNPSFAFLGSLQPWKYLSGDSDTHPWLKIKGLSFRTSALHILVPINYIQGIILCCKKIFLIPIYLKK